MNPMKKMIAALFVTMMALVLFATTSAEADEAALDSFDTFYKTNFANPGEYGVYFEIKDDSLATVEKVMNASKSYLKKNSEQVSAETLIENPEEYDGKLIKLDNVVMVGCYSFKSADDPSQMIADRIDFLVDSIPGSVFVEPGSVDYVYDKVVNIYLVSFGYSYKLYSDGTAVDIIAGWGVGKPVKSAKGKASARFYRFSINDYYDMSGTFRGPVKDGKPNGYGVLESKIEKDPVYVLGYFYDDQPLNGLYLTFAPAVKEFSEYIYSDGVFIQGAVYAFDDTTYDRTVLRWATGITRNEEDGTVGKMVYGVDDAETLNEYLYDVVHLDGKTGEEYHDALDVLFSFSDYRSGVSTNPDDIHIKDFNSYMRIDTIKNYTTKQIKKIASKIGAKELSGTFDPNENEVVRLDNLKVIEVNKADLPEDGIYTEIQAKADGVNFLFVMDGDKKLKKNDLVQVYFSYTGKTTLNPDGKEKQYVFGYAYNVKKQK